MSKYSIGQVVMPVRGLCQDDYLVGRVGIILSIRCITVNKHIINTYGIKFVKNYNPLEFMIADVPESEVVNVSMYKDTFEKMMIIPKDAVIQLDPLIWNMGLQYVDNPDAPITSHLHMTDGRYQICAKARDGHIGTYIVSPFALEVLPRATVTQYIPVIMKESATTNIKTNMKMIHWEKEKIKLTPMDDIPEEDPIEIGTTVRILAYPLCGKFGTVIKYFKDRDEYEIWVGTAHKNLVTISIPRNEFELLPDIGDTVLIRITESTSDDELTENQMLYNNKPARVIGIIKPDNMYVLEVDPQVLIMYPRKYVFPYNARVKKEIAKATSMTNDACED